MDIKAQIEQIVERINQDKALQAQFQKDPVKAVESVLGVDLPDDLVEKVVAGVKGKLTAGNLSGAMDALKKLF